MYLASRMRMIPSVGTVGLALSLALFAMAHGGVRAGDEGFVADLDDVPLLTGLTAQPGAGMVFDKPGGRLVESYASGPLKPAAVMDFYETTLPALGWRHLGELTFARDGEVLRIDMVPDEKLTTVRFVLAPE
jgi:hypothetical protein